MDESTEAFLNKLSHRMEQKDKRISELNEQLNECKIFVEYLLKQTENAENKTENELWDIVHNLSYEAQQLKAETFQLASLRKTHKAKIMTKPDWQIVVITTHFVDEVDCNSGKRRRVFNTGQIVPLS